ncbi:MAG: hypothetical protein A2Y07_03305 [Planctomycetes bacterium GWF2_50_10]|nr:MAG: hypothetical protein A2Y07_03305 [Planctomycetes bacterium GWF2_50_10]
MKNLSSIIYQNLGISPVVQQRVFTSLVLLFALALLRILLLRIVTRRTGNSLILHDWRKAVNCGTGFIAAASMGYVWFADFESLSLFVGLTLAAVIISLKELVLNVAGWLTIIARKPFEVGHRIQIGATAGDVIELGLLEFSVMEISSWSGSDQTTGRVLHIPNSKIFSETLANFSKGLDFIWDEITFTVTFESNWAKAKEILKNIGRQNAQDTLKTAQAHDKDPSKQVTICFDNSRSEIFTAVKQSGIELSLRFVCQLREKRLVENDLWEDILTAFALCDDIEFAYPTQRLYNAPVESKAASNMSHAQFVS